MRMLIRFGKVQHHWLAKKVGIFFKLYVLALFNLPINNYFAKIKGIVNAFVNEEMVTWFYKIQVKKIRNIIRLQSLQLVKEHI